ncbi:MAG: DNA polymerase [Nitrososphaeraceae archaeon]
MLVQTRKQFQAAIDTISLSGIAAVDTETNGLKVHHGHRLCGVAVYVELKQGYAIGWYFSFRHDLGNSLFTQGENLPLEWLQELGGVLSRSDLTTRWSNFKFDIGMLKADGIEIKGPIQDAMVMSQLVDENNKHSLEANEARYLGTHTKADLIESNIKPYLRGKKDYSRVPGNLMAPYAINDVRVTYLVCDPLIEELKRQDLWKLWPDESDFVRYLHELEDVGLLVNRQESKRLSDETEARMRILEDQIGFDPQKRNGLACRLFFPAPDGLGLPAGPRTRDTSSDWPNGIPKMDEAYLLTLLDEGPLGQPDQVNSLIRSVIEYRRLVKRNSSWYKGFLVHSDTDDRRMHPSYNHYGERDTYGTVTGRMSCSEPNIQQLPRDPRSGVRKLIECPHRFRHYVVDYNQIEYRLAGVYSGEQVIINAYREGSDMHQLTADKLGIPRVDPMGKIDGKRVNFATLYLAGAPKIAAVLGIDEYDAMEIKKEWWATYPSMKKYAWEVNNTAKQRKRIKLWDGHVRHFELEMDTHKAWNSLIQGGAAKIMQRSMVELYRRGRRPYRAIYQVHDALGFEIPDDFREDWIEEVTQIMEWPSADPNFLIDFPVEWKHVHPEKEVHTCTEECTV